MSPALHIVGAGLAGLAAAVEAASRGARVVVHEAAAQAGGRCRSYFDSRLGMVIDNGNHLLLSGNRSAHAYLRAIGALDRLPPPEETAIPFVDLRDGARWTLRPNDGLLPWWIADPGRRTPGARALDHLGLIGLLSPLREARIDEVLRCEGPLYERLLRPLLLAALNTPPPEASAPLAAAVIRNTLARGAQAYRPLLARPGVGAAFVDPALARLHALGAEVRLGARVAALGFTESRLSTLSVGGEEIRLGPDDSVVLAVPPWTAQELVPGLSAPTGHNAIVNAHFRIAPPPSLVSPGGAPHMLGVIGGAAEWIFAFPDRISVTVSAADRLLDEDRERLADALWADVARAHALPAGTPTPPWQIVKERRATFAATPEQAALRPRARTRWRNLFLAGDWTDTGLPATIEGAVQSGVTAARLARERRLAEA